MKVFSWLPDLCQSFTCLDLVFWYYFGLWQYNYPSKAYLITVICYTIYDSPLKDYCNKFKIQLASDDDKNNSVSVICKHILYCK